jgi:selenocysteine lyase/cysteine desulfurase
LPTVIKTQAVGLDLDRLRAETPGCVRRIHFNNAGAALMPLPVLEAMTDYLRAEADLGGYETATARRAEIDDFYAATAELLGCKPRNVAFATSATDAYARALSSVPFQRGDVILTTRDDYISNQIAFMSLRKRFGVEVAHAPNLPQGGVDVDALAALMQEHRPRVVAVTHIPTNSGLVQPVADIGARCRELDLLYLVDACQSLGQYVLDVRHIGCDFLTATSRKFLRGPRGGGVLYVSDRALEAAYEPLFVDMRGARWTGFGQYEQVDSAQRFEDWEFSYATVVGTAAAVRYALAVGMDAIAARTRALGEALRDALAEVSGVRVLDRGRELCAIVTLTVDGGSIDALHDELERRGINSSVSAREHALYDFTDKGVEAALRLSPHYYNTEGEVEAVMAAIASHAGTPAR